ncbi:MAG: hypothetical protein CR997_13135 [Acidobacteria bacterium]|nr:MAG: hypothetical protein CR997_13135 [Acidobacteriota bacterium]
MNPLPEQVERFLKNELNVYPPSFIKIDRDGLVLGHISLEKNTSLEIETGQKISDSFEALDRVFPCEEDVVSLPNVELDDKIFDIHMVFEDDTGWFILIETTENVIFFKRILNTYNECRSDLQKAQPAGIEDESYNLINTLGYTCFEYIDHDLFSLRGQAAEWSKPVFSYLDIMQDHIDLVAFHPFLDVFIDRACKLWRSENSCEFVRSGLWSETSSEGDVYALNAVAAKVSGKNLLLIGPAENASDKLQQLIQKARNKSLDYEQLEKAQKSLREMISFKNQFISIVSHDLRAPITSVITLLRLLIDGILPKKDGPDEVNHYLKKGLAELEQVLAYNQKIYNWSNLQLGRFTLDPQWVTLKKLLKNVGDTFQVQLEQKNISLKYILDVSIQIYADEALFTQLLNNLVGNAIKFTHPGGQITLKVHRRDNHCVLTVIDNGTGMSPEMIEGIMNNDFISSVKGTKGEKGTGLGLNICKKVIDAHEFQFDIESNPGRGSSMSVIFKDDAVKEIAKRSDYKMNRFLRFFRSR